MPIDLAELLAGRQLGRASTPLPVAALTMELQRGVMGDLATFPELAAAAEQQHIVANAARLLTGFRSKGLPVVHCTAEFRADRLGTARNTPLHSAALRRPEHLLAGTEATQLVAELGPEPGDLMSPRTHGVAPFTGTSLDALLRNLDVGVVVVTGVSVNLGILGCCIEAVDLGYQVVVATDAVTGVPLDYAATVVTGSLALVATLATVHEILAACGVGPGPPGS
jgi:nicotinamidase-related amidase